MTEVTFSEGEVNQLLEGQAIKLRLDGIDITLKDVNRNMLEHIQSEKQEIVQVMSAIEEGANERRRCEAQLRKEMLNLDKEHYNTFVKIKDLRLYAVIIITAVTITVGFITWLGALNTNKTNSTKSIEIIKQIETIIENKLNDYHTTN